MADPRVQIIIDALNLAQDELKEVNRELGDMENTGKKGASGIDKLSSVMGKAAVVGGTLIAAGYAAKKAWDFAKEGAQLQLTATQFENVATAAGYLPDVLLGRMKTATKGLVSDAELMASGLNIIELGLADSEDGVVRLATVVSTLGLDMQQVILTFANNSEMRLDALGLSVEGVRKRVEELNAEGFDGDAFDQAVLEGLEQRMATLGDTSETSAGKIQKFETVWTNAMNNAKVSAIGAIEPILDTQLAIWELKGALDTGIISQEEYNRFMVAGYQDSSNYADGLGVVRDRQDLVNGYVASGKVLLDAYNQSLDVGAGANNTYAERARNAAQANAEAGAAAAESNRSHQALNDTLTVAGQKYSDITTNVYNLVDALEKKVEFLTGGGGLLLELAAAAEQALDEGNFEGASVALDKAKEGSIDLDLELGNIDADEATQRLVEMGYPIDDAKAKVAEFQESLFAVAGQDYFVDVYIRTHGSVDVPGDYPGVELIPSGGGGESEFASGTGGWMRVPGAPGQPVPVTVHGGEMLNVVNPARGQSAGGNTVNWYGDAVFTTAGEAMDFLASMQSRANRNAASAMAGAGYVGQ